MLSGGMVRSWRRADRDVEEALPPLSVVVAGVGAAVAATVESALLRSCCCWRWRLDVTLIKGTPRLLTLRLRLVQFDRPFSSAAEATSEDDRDKSSWGESMQVAVFIEIWFK